MLKTKTTGLVLGMVVRTMYFPCSLATASPPLGYHCEKASISTLTFPARPLAWLLPSTQTSWSMMMVSVLLHGPSPTLSMHPQYSQVWRSVCLLT